MGSPYSIVPILLLMWGAAPLFGEDNKPAKLGISDAVKAAQRGDISRLIEIGRTGVSFDQRDPKTGLTPPEMARLSGRAETVEWFRGRGADVRAKLPPLDAIAEKRLGAGLDPKGPGFSVLVGRGDEILFQGGFGMADVAAGEPATPETVYRIGSITKQFTATAVLLLAEEGKLKLDDPLSKYMPEFPRAEQITLHHLLSHLSGMASYTSKPDFGKRAREAIDPAELIEWFQDDGFEFDPGAGYTYSNSGYFILGEIVSQVSEEPWGAFLKRRVFEPLEMGRTGVHRPGLGIVGESVGYAKWGEKIKVAPNWHMSWAGGAGAMYSTVTDLFKWNRAVFADGVLSAKMRRLAHNPVKIEDDLHTGETGGGYGYGWRINTYRGRQVVSHGGAVAGFLSHLAYVPADDLTVVVLSNSSPPAPGTTPSKIWASMADLFLWDKLTARPSFRRAAELDAEALRDYVGTYDFKLLGTLRVSVEGGKLRARLSAQPEVILEPQGSDTFYYADGGAEFTFDRDETDQVGVVTMIQAGFRISAERYTEPEVVEIAPEILRRFVGDYKLGSGILSIRVGEDGGLTAHLGGQPALPIFPYGDAEFFWKATRARIKFETDPKTGEVVAAERLQSEKWTVAPKMRPANSIGLD